MRNVIIVAAIVLAILHQDFWNWNDNTLVFGFMPIGLAYHALYSILAGCLWALAVVFAWPKDLEEEALEKAAETEKEVH